MPELFIHIANRSIVQMKEFRELFAMLKDGKYLVTIKDMRKRSLPLNRYYWGVVVPLVRKALYDQGYDDVRNNEDAHEVLKAIFLKKTLKNRVSGDEIVLDGSTAKLSMTEFNNFIEDICKWAATYLQIAIPSPNEQFVLYEEWEGKQLNDATKG